MKIKALFKATCSAATVLALLSSPVWARDFSKLVILHTNDTHGYVEADADSCGLSVLPAIKKKYEDKGYQVLLLDAGDATQDNQLANFSKGEFIIKLFNELGYDAMTIGNHEFDFGLDNMARVFRSLNFPIVCANYDFSNTPLDGVVKPYVILHRKGLRIGVFGLCPVLDGLVDHKNYEPIRYEDPVEKAKEMVALLKAQRCDVIVCLSHLGWDIGGMDDEAVIARTEGIDLVLGGHSHSYLQELAYVKNAKNQLVPVDQNGKHGIFIGKLILSFQKK